MSSDVQRVDIDEVADRGADQATIIVANYLGKWSNVFDLNQEVRFYVQFPGEVGLSHVWTGLIDSMDVERDQRNRSVIKLVANDFVNRIMGDLEVSYVYAGVDVADIIKDLCQTYAPEIDTSALAPVGMTLSVIANGQLMLDAVKDFCARADCTFYGDHLKKIHVIKRGTVSSGLTATYSQVAKIRPKKYRPEANVVRVWGGNTSVQGDTYDPVSKSLTSVTNSTRKTQSFKASKASVQKVSIWTDPPLDGAGQAIGDDLIVRIQADVSGAPKDVTNPQFDLGSKVLSPSKLTRGGYTDFFISSNTLGAGSTYWIIVEASGATGQNVGVDGSGLLAHKVWHAAPIIVERSDQSSVDTYRRIVKTIRNTSIQTSAEAQQIADGELARTAYSRWDVEFDVIDVALLAASIGQTVTLSFADDGVTGDFWLQRRRHVYDAEAGGYSMTFVGTQRKTKPTTAGVISGLAARISKVEDAVIGTNNSFITDLFRAFAESFKLSDTLATTVGTPGGYVVGGSDALVGLCDTA